MTKEFVSYNQIRNNALNLAFQIRQDGFMPDVIYVSLRGGAYMGNVISEYFKVLRKGLRPILYAAVVARSYSDVHQNSKVRIDGWTYNPEHLRSGDKILLVDDIYDSGQTVNYLVDILVEKGIPRSDIKVVVHDYKVRSNKNTKHDVVPDYYHRKIVIDSDKQDNWIHYLSHELVGLNESEIKKNYGEDQQTVEILLELLSDD